MIMRTLLVSFFLLSLTATTQLLANGITVQKVSLSDTNRTEKTVAIRFNISWENSWRDSINWDAAWIFVKFREPKDSVWRYRHVTLSQTGNIPGTGNANMKFAIPDDRKGAFYYRSEMGSGHLKMDSVKLLWHYGADLVTNIDSVEVKLFATEMVYVPGGSFALGDGNGSLKSNSAFQLKNAPNNYVMITEQWSPLINTKNNNELSGQDDITLFNDGVRISGLQGLDINNDKIADLPDFPTGYRSFYCMKYDVTQGQYTDFLNTLSLRDSSTFSPFLSDTVRLKRINPKYKLALRRLDVFYFSKPLNPLRHTIALDTVQGKYTVTRPDRAIGNTSPEQALSFNDWAGLRPISEPEFEKAARGPMAPVYKKISSYAISDSSLGWSGFDWAWGNDTLSNRVTSYNANLILNYNGVENGKEFFTNYNYLKRYFNPLFANSSRNPTATIERRFTGGDQEDGPYRVGIFATDSSDRIISGASYYGIMDLSKGVGKNVVSMGLETGRSQSFKKHGDGYLNAYGNHEPLEFSSINLSFGIASASFIYRLEAVSNRNNNSTYTGIRCVRTAPSDN